MITDGQAVTCWHLLLERMNSVGVLLTVPSSSGCLTSMTGEAGESTSLCMESMHISETQQPANAADWLPEAILTVTLDVSWLSRAGAPAWLSGEMGS